MKIKHALIVLFLFVYSVAFGQQSKNMCAQVDVNQREQISVCIFQNCETCVADFFRRCNIGEIFFEYVHFFIYKVCISENVFIFVGKI